MDIQDLSAKVMARCAIRVEAHDPAFVLVALNQIVLEETAREMYSQVDARIAAFAESIQKLERLAGKTMAQEIKASGVEVRRGIQDDMKEASWKARELILQMNRLHSRAGLIRWAVVGLIGAFLMFAFGVCFGRYVPLT
jgi:hypothetical protein